MFDRDIMRGRIQVMSLAERQQMRDNATVIAAGVDGDSERAQDARSRCFAMIALIDEVAVAE